MATGCIVACSLLQLHWWFRFIKYGTAVFLKNSTFSEESCVKVLELDIRRSRVSESAEKSSGSVAFCLGFIFCITFRAKKLEYVGVRSVALWSGEHHTSQNVHDSTCACQSRVVTQLRADRTQDLSLNVARAFFVTLFSVCFGLYSAHHYLEWDESLPFCLSCVFVWSKRAVVV